MQTQEMEIVRLENNQEELTQGWIILFMPECVYFQEGPGLRKWQFGETGIPFLNIRTFNNGIIDKTKCQFVKQEEFHGKYNHFLLDEGDIVVSSSGTIGKVAIIRKDDLPLMLNTSVIRFRSLYPDNLLQEYLKYYLQSRHFLSQLGASITGSAISNYGPSHLKQMRILVPPANEQRRIVAKLEKLLAKVDTCKERLEKIPAILKRFRQSVLAAACSGRLTADWRENNPDVESAEELLKRIREERIKRHQDSGRRNTSIEEFIIQKPEDILPELPNNWHWVALGNYAECSRGRFSIRPRNDPRYYGGQYPFIQIGDLPRDGGLIASHQQTLNEQGLAVSKMFPKGTVAIAIVGATIGNSGILAYDMCFPDSLVGIQTASDVGNLYLNYYLTSEKENIRNVSYAGGGQPNIKLETLNPYPFPLPPYKEQQEIVRRVQTLFKTADQIEQRYRKARTYIDQLTQSILAKAFRGELVPHYPNDEPASVLLERIRAERENRENVAQTAKKPAVNKKQRSKKAQPQLEPIQLELPGMESNF
jgi:type I restriction enzyme S subunit